ncbi:uncharacterized protein [Montipora capricornis]|uniref:uncharacterized protein n=1 Tax=Montipora capricornis TaxID=246305 RepID=UPI0035F113D1
MSDTDMGQVIQENEDSLSISILLNSDSSSSIQHSQIELTTTEESYSFESMNDVQDAEHFSTSDTEADSAIMLLKSLNSESPSSSFVSRRNDNFAIIRLNQELLKSKKSNWEVVDALQKAYEVIGYLRLREQRLNAMLSGYISKHVGTNYLVETLTLPESNIIERQLALRREEAMKTREELRTIMEERDRLKEKLGRTESNRRLVLLTKDQCEKELELSHNYVKDLAANMEDKDAKILSAKNKLASLEDRLKDKESEIKEIRDERDSLRDAVIRSEKQIETLSEKLQSILLCREQDIERKNDSIKNASISFGIQTFDTVGKTVNEGQPFLGQETRLDRELRFVPHEMEIIHDLKSRLAEWESTMKSMNDIVQNTNQQQQSWRKEIADYVQMLEKHLLEITKKCTLSDQELVGDLEQCSTASGLQQSAEYNDFRNTCPSSSQETEPSPDLDENEDDNDPFEAAGEQEDFNLRSCFKSSIEHLIKPGNIKIARIRTMDSFVSPRLTVRETNIEEFSTPQRPPRKKRDEKGRKLPELPRDTLGIRRGSHGRSNLRRLSSVPSGEEITLEGDDTNMEPPGVLSIYKPPNVSSDHRNIFSSGEITVGAPISFRSSHRFSLSNIKRKLSRGRKGSGSKADIPLEAKKGFLRRTFALMRRRNRKNSIDTVTSVSDSFRTVTPLNSDHDEVGGIRNVSFGSIEMMPSSPIRTSTPKGKGRVCRQSICLNERRRKCLLLIFQFLNPIELCGLARVCREWRQISELPTLWKHVILEDILVNNMILQSISRKCSAARSLKLTGLKKMKSEDKTSSLSIDEMSCYLERGLEFLLKAAGSSLLRLHIEDCGVYITDRCLATASCYCRELQEINYISDSFPACPEALWALWGCRKLRNLSVPPMFPCLHSGRFNDRSLEMISNCWPNLRQLSVGGPGITSAGLIHIAKGCLRLQELELYRAILINEEIAHAMCSYGLRGMEMIKFTFTPISPGAIKELLGACPRLEDIEVHVGISDYFSDVEDDNNIRNYWRIIRNLMALKEENSEFARVLWIKADYG